MIHRSDDLLLFLCLAELLGSQCFQAVCICDIFDDLYVVQHIISSSICYYRLRTVIP